MLQNYYPCSNAENRIRIFKDYSELPKNVNTKNDYTDT